MDLTHLSSSTIPDEERSVNQNGIWLYEHLEPFLRRMDRKAAFDALRESVERGHLTQEQLEALLEEWAAHEVERIRRLAL